MKKWLNHKLFGDAGEKAAARFLKKAGLRILARQESTRWGEIDLICVDGETVVFVEVKTRKSGNPAERIDQKKMKNMTKSAMAWLKKHNLLDRHARFDLVTVVWPEDARKPEIEHFENAFDAVDY